MDKKARLAEICQALAISAVRDALIQVFQMSDVERRELVALDGWKRVRNFAIQNKIAEFNGDSIVSINPVSSDVCVAQFLQRQFLSDVFNLQAVTKEITTIQE